MTIRKIVREPVLITDGTERAALASARSLIALGHSVTVTAGHGPSLAGVSRGVKFSRLETNPLESPEAYSQEIGALAARLGTRLVLPVTDASVEALLEHTGRLPAGVSLPLPGLATYRVASDKLQMLEAAHAAGIAVPETITLRTPADVSTIPDTTAFPAFVKPHRSVVTDAGELRTRRKLGVTRVDNIGACRALLDALPDAAFPVLLQQPVHGPGEGVFFLRWNGRIVAEFAHRRLREKPPGGGVSVYRESIPMPPDLAEAGRRMLERLNWQGVAMIECKRDRFTGRHVFMEVNGRLWGSLQLAIDAGVDFPGLLAACALGHTVPSSPGYRPGVRSRWFWGDLDSLYLRLTRSAASLGLEKDSPGRIAALRDFFSFRRSYDSEEIWRFSDPRPFLLETSGRFGLGPR